MTSDPDLERIFAEAESIRDALAPHLFAWNALEQNLCLLLTEAINNRVVGPALYYAPTNTETRLSLIDAAMRALAPNSDAGVNFIEAWNSLKTSIERLKNTRNRVAHGTITQITNGRGRTFSRLTSAVLDFDRTAPKGKNQLPGMSASDIVTSTSAINSTATSVRAFVAAVHAARSGDPLLGEILQRAKCHSKKG